MRLFRRRVLHAVTLFLVLYTGAIFFFAKMTLIPRENPHEGFSIEMEYDFEKDIRKWEADESNHQDPEVVEEEEERDNEDEHKIDWHNYDLLNSDKLRQGHGDQGLPVFVSPEEVNAVPAKFKDIGYNVAAGMKVSLERAFPDLRDPNCFAKLYRKSLPTVSVIIPFHNEMNLTLLRTIHSLVRHSPPELTKEVILVDDASTDVELKEPLEGYLNATFSNSSVAIRILRIPDKRGLMNARSLGATHAQSDVLIMIDAHVEVGINFLPPLIEPIAENYKTITNPIVGAIDSKDFRIFSNNWYAGGVSGRMNYTYFNAHARYVSKPTVPYPNPVMIGCAFAISKRWWEELEGYDPQLRMWGSEQFELSFKTWMCGGNQVNVPCSRIAHLFRPRREGSSMEDVSARENNLHRVALAWMDEYVDYVYLIYDRLLKMDPGDVSQQMRLRKRLKCKSFDWFMRNIQPEMLQLEPFPKRNYVAWGKISSRHDNGKCIRIRETMGFPDFTLTDCEWGDDGAMPEHFHYTLDGFLSTTVRKPSVCLAPGGSVQQNKLGLFPCIKNDHRQIWSYNSVNGLLTNLITMLCMEKDLFNSTVYLRHCDVNSASQAWDFQFMEPNVKFY